MISELQLTTPCTMKKLCEMPEPRSGHGAEVFEDKVLVLGGGKSHYMKDFFDSVLEFDAKKNESDATITTSVVTNGNSSLERSSSCTWRL